MLECKYPVSLYSNYTAVFFVVDGWSKPEHFTIIEINLVQ